MSLDFPYAGEIYSVGCAFIWAVAVLFLRKSGEQVSPVALNLFKNVLAVVFLLVTIAIVGSSVLPAERTAREWAILLASGFLGLGVADTLFLASLNRLGAGRSAIVDCFYSPSVILWAAILLPDEPMRPPIFLALALVIAAVLVGSWESSTAQGPTNRRDLVVGFLLGIGAMVTMAFGIVLARPVLQDRAVDSWWATLVRLVDGCVLPLVLGLTPRNRADVIRAFTPGPAWRVTVPGAFIGTYLSMVVWILSMRFSAQTATAAILNQSSTVFVLILATIFLKEPLTGRKVAAIVLGSAGALVAGFFGHG